MHYKYSQKLIVNDADCTQSLALPAGRPVRTGDVCLFVCLAFNGTSAQKGY